MADPGATMLARVAAAVGNSHVLTAPADTEPYLVDWRGRYRGAARAVVEELERRRVNLVMRMRRYYLALGKELFTGFLVALKKSRRAAAAAGVRRGRDAGEWGVSESLSSVSAAAAWGERGLLPHS